MEVWIVYPIGGLLSVFGVMILLGLYAAFVGASEHQMIIEDFAAQNTDVVLIVLLAIAVIYGTFVWYILHEDSKHKYGFPSCLFHGLTVAIPGFLSLTVCYLLIIEFLSFIIQSAAQSIIMVVLALCWTFPICLVIYGFFCALALAPNCLPLFLIGILQDRKSHLQEEGLMWLLCIVMSALYVVFIRFMPMFPVSFSNILP